MTLNGDRMILSITLPGKRDPGNVLVEKSRKAKKREQTLFVEEELFSNLIKNKILFFFSPEFSSQQKNLSFHVKIENSKWNDSKIMNNY